MDNFLLTIMNQFICYKNTEKISSTTNVIGTVQETWENRDLHARMTVFYNNKSGYIYSIHFA